MRLPPGRARLLRAGLRVPCKRTFSTVKNDVEATARFA